MKLHFSLLVLLCLVFLCGTASAGNETIKDKVEVKGVTFEYSEVKYGSSGAGQRGIKIWRKGVAKDDNSYKFSPNPHDNKKKYPKHAEAFYKAAATAIGTFVTNKDNKNKYPAPGKLKFTWESVEYTCAAP
ncbi:MAG: hypothetical protein HUU50_21240 [Candidatus Brocadiae bacterium]|nr:hypothetical protein [Candidatus Brocadiia bacterium]